MLLPDPVQGTARNSVKPMVHVPKRPMREDVLAAPANHRTVGDVLSAKCSPCWSDMHRDHREQLLEVTVHGIPCAPSSCTRRRMILSADPHLPDMHRSTSAIQNADTHMHSHVWNHTVCIYPFDKQYSHKQPKRTSVHLAIQSIADTAEPSRAPSQ